MQENKQKSIKHLWSILCQSSSIDAQSNILSLFNVVEQIVVDLTPEITDSNAGKERPVAVAFRFEIVSLWQKIGEANKNNTVEIEFLDPMGISLMKTDYSLQIPQDKKRIRHSMKVNGLKVTIDGEYTFKIRIKESDQKEFYEVAELSLDVIINKNS